MGSVIHNSTRFKRRCHDKEWQSQITSKAELRLHKWRQLRGRRGSSEAAVLQMEPRTIVAGGPGGRGAVEAMASPDQLILSLTGQGREGGRLCPPQYYVPHRIFIPSYGPGAMFGGLPKK